MLQNILQYLDNNPFWIYASASVLMLVGLFLKKYGAKLLSAILYTFFKKYAKNLHSKQFIVLIRKPAELFFMGLVIIGVYHILKLSNDLKLINREYEFGSYIVDSFKIYMILTLTWSVMRVTDFIGYVFKIRTRQFSRVDPQMVLFLKDLSKIIIILASFFIVLKKVFHEDAAGMITGLGIGGLAIALAAQETIANLIGSIIIFSDKPFTVGDLVETPEIKGVVEQVGFRSTRIRTMDKTLLSVPNKKLVDSALNNLSRAEIRRIRFTLCLTYDASATQIKNIIDDIKKELQTNERVENNYLVTFAELQNNYLGIDVIYFANTDDFDILAAVRQEINFKIIDIVHHHEARFVAQNPALIFADNFKKK
ncbi:MAG: mechanosensitive ion channel family protein [Bacteroidetes bacterium]|nr:mechanosensitive ion channel family protein [Bacteroidota bacterium]